MLSHPCHRRTFLNVHDLAGVELHLQAPVGLVLVQPAVRGEGVLLALAGHADLHAAQEPAGVPTRAVVPDHQPVDLGGNPGEWVNKVLCPGTCMLPSLLTSPDTCASCSRSGPSGDSG